MFAFATDSNFTKKLNSDKRTKIRKKILEYVKRRNFPHNNENTHISTALTREKLSAAFLRAFISVAPYIFFRCTS